ncbi:cytosolic carboxypeptidase 2 isoform X3 [Heterodontus francisci]|uniref:cytosolic carboxypeptidase 2 isoform X3 n=1 Tax=Heterodontus francisci TaxID=7792 RepID=UPI00355C8336
MKKNHNMKQTRETAPGPCEWQETKSREDNWETEGTAEEMACSLEQVGYVSSSCQSLGLEDFSGNSSELMKVQSWQHDVGLQSDELLSQSDKSSSRSNSTSPEDEEESCKFKYSFIKEHHLLRTRQVVFAYHAGKHIPCLREPRSLYAVATNGPQQAPRWPIECEVIKEQIHHIEWTPPEPEKLYQRSWQEHMPTCVGNNGRDMVFCIDGARKGSYFTCSRVGGRRGLIRLGTVGVNSKDCNTLIFESRFESGNLQKAVRVGIYEYELTLRTDLYTDKHTQWYYFRVQNTRPEVTYRFTIVNLMKSNSLYNQGLKPLLYSEREAQLRQVGWYRVGKDIRYYKNNLDQEGRSLYSLTWTCQFPHRNDTCYFAHSYPYTYSDLQRYLATIASDPIQSQYCKLRVLCRSLAGNMVHTLTITSPSRCQETGSAKKAVVVTARVHPGETNGSWVMTGFLDHILGSSDDARLLRDMFVFKVVPMLNPDGVITGNYRCSLTGRDLNRNYRTVLRDSFPCVWHTRNMVQRLMEEREVVIYCDFHGHSRKNNVFMYGCSNKEIPSLRFWERVFPLMMSKNAVDKFSYQSCKFKVQKCKEGTGRIVMWKMGIAHSYTMETTFAGSTLGNRRATHFSTEDLKSLGYHFCDTLLDFCDPDRSKFEQCLTEVRAALRREFLLRLEKLGREYNSDVTLSDLSISDLESSTSGSDSSESDGPPAHLMILAQKSRQKKKRLRTRKERNRLRQHQLLNVPSLPSQLRHQMVPGEKVTKQSKVQGNSNKTSQSKKVVAKLQHTHGEHIPPARPWMPQNRSGLSMLCDVSAKKKAAWFEAMTTAHLRKGSIAAPGQKYAGDYLRFGETTPLAKNNEAQKMSLTTDVLLRKNLSTSPDVSKSLKRAERTNSSSRSWVQEASGRRQRPAGLLTMTTASLVSMDTLLEQKGDVTNIQEGLSKVPPAPEPQPALLQSTKTAANRKRNKRFQKLSATAHRPPLLKGVSGRTVAIHQLSRALASGAQLSDPTTAGCTDGLGRASHRKLQEMQHKVSDCETQRKIKRNSLVETLKHQLSTVCLWEDSKQSLHSSKSQNSSTVI